VLDLDEAARRATVSVVLVPDEAQPAVYREAIGPGLAAGDALVFAHGFAVAYGLIEPPAGVDLLLLAPRMPGRYVRERFLAGWGVPAFAGVERDATGRARDRLLGLASALGITRCGAIETTFAEETHLDHFSEHFTYPLLFRALELAFETLVDEGFTPEVALMELHGSGEMGEVLSAAAREGLFGMLDSHASPACQAGIAHHYNGGEAELRARMASVLAAIRSGEFARHLVAEQGRGHPELRGWRAARSARLEEAEARLRALLRPPPGVW
jgi:ketol-acid reductoisomerase